MNNQDLDIFKLEVDETAKNTMLEMSRWTKFLAVLGFIFIGLMLLFGIWFSTYAASLYENMGASGINSTVIFIYMIFLGGLYFYPTFALLKYSTTIKRALNTGDQAQFNKAIRYQKNMFKFMGILFIVLIALYGVIIIFYLITVAGRL